MHVQVQVQVQACAGAGAGRRFCLLPFSCEGAFDMARVLYIYRRGVCLGACVGAGACAYAGAYEVVFCTN